MERVFIERVLIEVITMNKFSITLVLALLAIVFVSGCSTPETAQERGFRISQSWKLDRRMFIDDSDDFWLIDKNSMLSRFHQRLGY